MSSRWIRAAVACSALTLSSLALAQTWPARAVKVIVPFGPGGSADTLGRLASTKLTEALGQSFVVENRGGAGGMVGSELVAKSAPAVSYGSPGIGTHGHLFAELIKQRQGIEMSHVPYKGAAQAVADLIAGHLQAVSTTLTTAGSQIRAGKALALAISAEKRLPDYPNAPTFKELGYPDLTAVTWFSLSGPAGIPAEIVNRVNAETRRGLHMADSRERMRPEGIEPGDLDPKQFTEFVIAEVKRWTPVVKASGAKPE